jgi:D-psicose/D-tagatose/L-ribulose 3-epimerase
MKNRTLELTLGLGIVFLSTLSLSPAMGADKVQIGLCTDDLAKAKKAGFDYVELPVRSFATLSDEEFGNLLARHKAAGIPTPVGNLFLPGDLKVVGPQIDPKAQLEYVGKAFDRAAKLGLKVIVFGSGGSRKVPEGFSKDEAMKQLVDFAKRIAPEAKKRRIVVAVEPLRSQETNTINSAAEGLAWVQAVGHPNFQLMVDFYHLASEKEDAAILVKARKEVRHIHIANPTGRVYPLSGEEYDYSAFFENLRKIKYQGGISVEGRTKDFDADAPRTLAFLRAAAKDGVKPPAAKPESPTSTTTTPAAPAAPVSPK